jgi:exodeoxyribonuclease III
MKVITWNCNMAFRKKAALLGKYKPDIVVVQECEHPDRLLFSAGTVKPTDMLWFGTNPNKGLGIFAYNGYKLKAPDTHYEAIKMVVPIGVSGGPFAFTLFAIWANNPADPDGQYVEQVWKAVHHYQEQINKQRTMLIGDFNSNTIWDRKSRTGNHSDLVKVLEEKGIQSAYHVHHAQIQGQEKHPTFYLYRHPDKRYHLDYCFISADMTQQLQKVQIGRHHFWKQFSDHVPVIITFDTLK